MSIRKFYSLESAKCKQTQPFVLVSLLATATGIPPHTFQDENLFTPEDEGRLH